MTPIVDPEGMELRTRLLSDPKNVGRWLWVGDTFHDSDGRRWTAWSIDRVAGTATLRRQAPAFGTVDEVLGRDDFAARVRSGDLELYACCPADSEQWAAGRRAALALGSPEAVR